MRLLDVNPSEWRLISVRESPIVCPTVTKTEALMKREEILKAADGEGVRFMRLQFTDILGVIKNVEIPRSQFEKALDGQILFAGSSIEGFTRIEESDMLLVPDLNTFPVNPWSNPDGSKVSRNICTIPPPAPEPCRGRPPPHLQSH